MGRRARIARSSVFIIVIIVVATAAAVTVVFHSATTREEESKLGSAFVYDLDDLRKTDPTLIKYKELGEIETGFQHVSAVAVDSKDRVYVAGDKAIRVFDDNGGVISTIELADSPRSVSYTHLTLPTN